MEQWNHGKWMILTLLIVSMFSCTEDPSPMECVPGDVKECPCPLDGFGSQACLEDGSGYDICDCRYELTAGESCPVEYTVPCESGPPEQQYCCREGRCCPGQGNGCCHDSTPDAGEDTGFSEGEDTGGIMN